MGDTRGRGPFAILELRELAGLRAVKATPIEIAALVALRLGADKKTGWTTWGLEALASWASMKPRTMQTALRRLRSLKLVEDRAEQRRGGPKGSAWLYRRRALPFEEWPERLRAEASSYLSASDKSALDGEPSSPSKRTHSEGEEDAAKRARGRMATRDNPESSPESLPERGSLREDDKDALLVLVAQAYGTAMAPTILANYARLTTPGQRAAARAQYAKDARRLAVAR